MGRKPTPQPLNLADQSNDAADNISSATSTSLAALSLDTSVQQSTPLSGSYSSNRPHTAKSPHGPPSDLSDHQYPQTARETTAPNYPPPPPFESPSFPLPQSASGSRRPSRSGFFNFSKGHKASAQEPSQTSSISTQRDQLVSRDGAEPDSATTSSE